MAEVHYLPIAPHNCGGSVLHAATLHYALNVPNLYIMESVRRHYEQDHEGILYKRLAPVGGEFDFPPGPGLGVELLEEVFTQPDIALRRSPA